MNLSLSLSLTSSPWSLSLESLREEVRHLVESRRVSRRQPLYALSQFIPPREWNQLERLLVQADFLLRDRIGDLLSEECWDSD